MLYVVSDSLGTVFLNFARLFGYAERKKGVQTMEKLTVENALGVKIYINGRPDCRLIAEDKDSGFLQALELQISDYYKEKKARENHKEDK